MDCPTCKQELVRQQYEGVPVFQCPNCLGYIVEQKRLVLIKARRDLTPDQLQAQAESQARSESSESLKCPKCLVGKMERKTINKDSEQPYAIDTCKKCQVVWFDGGELAKMQLDFETSSVAIEQLQFQTKGGPLQIEASDRPAPSFMEQATSEAISLVVLAVSLFAACVLILVGLKFAGLLCSFIFTAALIWVGLRMFDESAKKIGLLVVAAILQSAFLIAFLVV